MTRYSIELDTSKDIDFFGLRKIYPTNVGRRCLILLRNRTRCYKKFFQKSSL